MGNSTLALLNGVARTAAGAGYRARIEALLGKADDEMLADLWQKVFPYRVDELPQRHAIVEDLADFAEVLQPRLAEMRADELCGLIERYAAKRRRSGRLARTLIYGAGVERTATAAMTSAPMIPVAT